MNEEKDDKYSVQPQANKYTDLDPKLRAFLEAMDEEDVETAKNLMRTYRNAGIVTQAFKWFIIIAFTITMGALGLVEKLGKFFGLIK